MNQVITYVDAVQRRQKTVGVECISFDKACSTQGVLAHMRAIPHYTCDLVTRLYQLWYQFAANISGFTRNQDFHKETEFSRQISKLNSDENRTVNQLCLGMGTLKAGNLRDEFLRVELPCGAG